MTVNAQGIGYLLLGSFITDVSLVFFESNVMRIYLKLDTQTEK